MYNRNNLFYLYTWDKIQNQEKYLLYKGLIHALTILAEPTLSAHLVDKDLFAVASEDSLETQTAGKSK